MDTLSDKHQAFVQEYIANKFNATQAYMKVYECDYETANANGSRLLVNASIRDAVDSEIDIILNEKRELSVRVLDRLKEIALSKEDASDSNRIRACEILAKYLGLNRDTENEASSSMRDAILALYKRKDA